MASIRKLLKTAIQSDGRSLPEIAKAAGIDRAQLWRFVTDKRDVTTETTDALLAGLGLECRLIRRRGAKGGKR